MIFYRKMQLANDEQIGGLSPLPPELEGLADESLADLGWTDESLGFHGFGFFPVKVPEPANMRRSKIDFWRLFTAEEETRFNRTRRQVQALADADYDDTAKAGLVAMERFLNRFDATPVVELDHPETLEGVDLLVMLDIITLERAAQVKAGEQPA